MGEPCKRDLIPSVFPRCSTIFKCVRTSHARIAIALCVWPSFEIQGTLLPELPRMAESSTTNWDLALSNDPTIISEFTNSPLCFIVRHAKSSHLPRRSQRRRNVPTRTEGGNRHLDIQSNNDTERRENWLTFDAEPLFLPYSVSTLGLHEHISYPDVLSAVLDCVANTALVT